MITVRKRYEAETHRYLEQLKEKNGEIPENVKQAIDLRTKFVKDYVINRKATNYETLVEKDFTYLVRREYFWDVNLRAVGDGCFAGNAACVIGMFMRKKAVFFPFIPVFAAVSVMRNHNLALFFSKKHFDMLNLGEQYEVGRERNKVLRECNRLLDVEDF